MLRKKIKRKNLTLKVKKKVITNRIRSIIKAKAKITK
jgi:hypothetical protein